jgi:hypothetical protein
MNTETSPEEEAPTPVLAIMTKKFTAPGGKWLPDIVTVKVRVGTVLLKTKRWPSDPDRYKQVDHHAEFTGVTAKDYAKAFVAMMNKGLTIDTGAVCVVDKSNKMQITTWKSIVGSDVEIIEREVAV